MRGGTLRGARFLACTLAALGFAVAVSACSSDGDPNALGNGNPQDPSAGTGGDNPAPGGGPGGGGGGPGGGPGTAPGDTPVTPVNLDLRVVNYTEAMRSASLKLVGELPTLADVKTLDGKSDADAKIAYEAFIDKLLTNDPRFASRQIQWWRDTFKTGGGPKGMAPSFDTAATFAASVVVGDRPYTDLFTASAGTCPTFASGAFTPADCPAGAPTTGILTDPGIQAQYYANLAFRRVRFIQETFVCSKFPTEFGQSTPMGAGLDTSPWDFNSITGKTSAPNPAPRIDFQDTSAVICANCHTTMNHIAPLFANFDMNGAYNATAIQVLTPSTGTPKAVLGDWLPAGKQTFAWRNGVAVTDLPSLGKAIAADPVVAQCAVNRVWNWAMSRGDIVNDLATIPPVVTDPLVKDFTTNGFKMKRMIRNVFTSADFVKF